MITRNEVQIEELEKALSVPRKHYSHLDKIQAAEIIEQKNEIVANMSHTMGIPKEKLLKALHKSEAHKQAERDIEDAMKYLNSGDGEGSDDESSLVPEKMEPEEVQRIAKERLREIKAAAGDSKDEVKEEKAEEVQAESDLKKVIFKTSSLKPVVEGDDLNPTGGTEIKGMVPGAQSEANLDLGSIGGNSLPRLQRNMSVGTVATADTMAGSLMAPPFGFGMQKQYKKLG